jgi:hypothetical protein
MLWQWQCNLQFQSYGMCDTGSREEGHLVFWRDVVPLFTRWSAPARVHSYVSHLRRPELFTLAFIWMYLPVFWCLCLDICSLVYVHSCLLSYSFTVWHIYWVTYVIMSLSTSGLSSPLFFMQMRVGRSIKTQLLCFDGPTHPHLHLLVYYALIQWHYFIWQLTSVLQSISHDGRRCCVHTF